MQTDHDYDYAGEDCDWDPNQHMNCKEIILRSLNDEHTARPTCEPQADTDASPDIEENDNFRSIYSNMMISKQRKYCSKNQKHGLRRVSNIRSRWMEIAQKNEAQIRAMKLCKRLKCFKFVSVSNLKEQTMHLFSL